MCLPSSLRCILRLLRNDTPHHLTYKTNPSLRRVALHVVARVFDSRRYHRHPRLQGSRLRTDQTNLRSTTPRPDITIQNT
ncbi:hypothetical protein VTJ04DRAFT_7249 [Mycothermus thermophilus]|uniref:uncharacterized protein n=1 Tax=Humicola insolens TaxID=85995 RepID=UPI0037423422